VDPRKKIDFEAVEQNGIIMPLIRAAFLSDAEHRDLLIQAGFTEVVTKHVPGKNWICATGRKP
jgi:hypothetical protein